MGERSTLDLATDWLEQRYAPRERKAEPYKLACFVGHPIQYFSPLYRYLSGIPELDLNVFYLSDFSARAHRDSGFGVNFEWDVPLLEGYQYEFLPALTRDNSRFSFWRPLNYEISKRLHCERYDALMVHGYAHNSMLRAIASAKALGMKVLVRGDSHLLGRNLRGPMAALKYRVLRKLFGTLDAFLAIGTLNREFYRYHGVPNEKIFLTPFAVDNDFFREGARRARSSREQLRASLGLEKRRPVILFASKLQKRKHPDHLLEAYIRLSSDGRRGPQPYLLFVGDGELRQSLEQRAVRLGWNSVKFLGFKNQSELPRYYDLCDVFVLPSEGEPWGLVINEVMNAGKPIIVSDQVGAAPDLVRDGVNGFVVPSGDVRALSDRLCLLMAAPELAAKMGEESWRRIATWSLRETATGVLEALVATVR